MDDVPSSFSHAQVPPPWVVVVVGGGGLVVGGGGGAVVAGGGGGAVVAGGGGGAVGDAPDEELEPAPDGVPLGCPLLDGAMIEVEVCEVRELGVTTDQDPFTDPYCSVMPWPLACPEPLSPA